MHLPLAKAVKGLTVLISFAVSIINRLQQLHDSILDSNRQCTECKHTDLFFSLAE